MNDVTLQVEDVFIHHIYMADSLASPDRRRGQTGRHNRSSLLSREMSNSTSGCSTDTSCYQRAEATGLLVQRAQYDRSQAG